jgi:WD40 repeat protein
MTNIFHYFKAFLLSELLPEHYLTHSLSLVSQLNPNDNLIEKRRKNIVRQLSKLPSKVAEIISYYDYELEGKSYTFIGHRKDITSLIIIPFEKSIRLVSAADFGILKIWNLQNGSCEICSGNYESIVPNTTILNECYISSIASLGDGRIVIGYGLVDQHLKIWNPITNKCVEVKYAHFSKISYIIIINDKIITASQNGKIKVWDFSLKLIRNLNGHSGPISHLGVLSNCNLVTYANDNLIKIWDVENGICILSIEPYPEIENQYVKIACIAILLDSNILSISNIGKNKIFKIWNPITGSCIIEYKYSAERVNCVAVLPNGFIVYGDDCNLKIANPYTGKHIKTLIGHIGIITCVIVLPSCGRIVSGSYDTSIKLWS